MTKNFLGDNISKCFTSFLAKGAFHILRIESAKVTSFLAKGAFDILQIE